MTPPLPAEWYCLRTQPKHEHIAAAHLRRAMNIEVFCPHLRFQRARRQGSGKTWVTEALFPGYLLARFELESRVREVQYAHGVRGVVHFGEKYPVVPDAFVESLRALIGEEEVAVINAAPVPGEEIIIAEGVFSGLRALVTVYLPAKERVRVLLAFMGRDMEVEIPRATVAPSSFIHPLK